MRQGAASTGKLGGPPFILHAGGMWRGSRGFLLTREAPAHGRDQTMPKGFFEGREETPDYPEQSAQPRRRETAALPSWSGSPAIRSTGAIQEAMPRQTARVLR